jgi:beta-phosphoglucomutase
VATLRAAIFDFDGVLVNSEPLHFRALREALLPEGISIDEEAYANQYLAYDDRGAIRLALGNHAKPADRAKIEEVAARKAELFDGWLPGIPFFAGARELVRRLADAMPVAIASGALTREIEVMLKGGGMHDAFGAIVGADQVKNGKPHPEPYLVAMQRIADKAPGLAPEECLVFEDSPPGIASALAAGMKVVAVTNSYPAQKLGAANRVVDSLHGLEMVSLRELF